MNRTLARWIWTLALPLGLGAATATAHPLGNFSINQLARLEPAGDRVHVHYVADLAEIPAYQEIQRIDVDGDGTTSRAELDAYVQREARAYADALTLEIDGRPSALEVRGRQIELAPGAGGLSTLRIELDLVATLAPGGTSTVHRLRFENNYLRGHAGWCEISLRGADGVRIFDSSAYAGSASEELRAYPQDRLTAPLEERTAELSFTTGALPQGARSVALRGPQPAPDAHDALASLIALPELGAAAIALALAAAWLLGATHALAPGHGKTIAAAYLVGTRAHWRHALYLALTVTVTHTAAVYALGFVTLGASRYLTPAQLLPVLSLVSGALVLGVGLALLARRLRSLSGHAHADHAHAHEHGHAHDPGHDHPPHGSTHDHGHGHDHSHLPPGADGTSPGWRSWLAFGISGGLVPCPSALVVMLSAIALERVAYGLVLVTAFSLGLATTLTAIGILCVYAGRGLKDRRIPAAWTRVVPVASALVITGVGIALCWEALNGMKSIAGPFWFGG